MMKVITKEHVLIEAKYAFFPQQEVCYYYYFFPLDFSLCLIFPTSKWQLSFNLEEKKWLGSLEEEKLAKLPSMKHL